MNAKKLIFASLVVAVHVSVEAAGATPACGEPKRKSATGARAKEPLVQEVLVSCGSQTANPINLANQITSTGAPEAKKDDQSSSSWVKFFEEFVKLIGNIAWPVAAVIIARFFKRELAALMARLKKGKWGDAEFEFENDVREVDKEADIPRAAEAESISPAAAARASMDPRGTIISTWIDVEEALYDLVKRCHLTVTSPSPRQGISTTAAINAVQKAQVLDGKWVSLFHDLRRLRNEAAHSTDFSPTADSVITYVQLAKELIIGLRSAPNSVTESLS